MAAVVTEVEGRTLRLTNLEKVMYPETNTTKAEVIEYYAAIAPAIVEQLRGRPVTRIRFPHGVAGQSFFEKNMPEGAPPWVPEMLVSSIRYPVFNEAAAVIWAAQSNALELHTPQWRDPGNCDRLVVDLDPGPGATLLQCTEVALIVRDYLANDGLAAKPVTSGSKGMQLYAPFPEPMASEAVLHYARLMANDLAKEHPDRIVATMSRSVREYRVFIDWSQNHPAKTTVTPYSLRGRVQPWAATPVTWDEVSDGLSQQFLHTQTARRLAQLGDLMAAPG